jgi:hypothetical protein
MASFAQTLNPTSFGFFDSETAFQTEADSMVTYVKRKLGDDVLSVELTKKEIWTCFEEAVCEYSRLVNETKIVSELSNVLGGSTGDDYTAKYTQNTLDFLLRKAEPYANESFVGGSVNPTMGYIDLVSGQQDYDLYTDLIHFGSGTALFANLPSGSKGKMKIVELFHVEPLAAQHYLLNASQRIMDDALVIEASLRLGYLLANTNTEHPAPTPTTPPPDALTDSIIAVAGPDIATITVIEALATRMITDHPGESAHIINRIARNKRATQLRPSRVMPEHLAKLQAKFATISTQANTTQRKQKNAPRSTASEGANPTKTP